MLGPLLFNLYVSDLARLADERGASLPSFADDFTLYASCKDPVDACDTVPNVLGVLDKALNTLGLQINEIKTVAMLIPPQSDKSSCENCKIVLRGSELNLVSETRLLRVIIDSSRPLVGCERRCCLQEGRTQDRCPENVVPAAHTFRQTLLLHFGNTTRLGVRCPC